MLGVWMWASALTRRDGAFAFDAMRRAGVTDVFFLTKGLDGTTAFTGGRAPAMAEGRDLLDEAIKFAHARGIRLHAWFTSASDVIYKEAHPEAGRCHYRNGRDKGLVSLTDQGYIDYMRHVVEDVTNRYAVDGVHLDYIRYNHLLYGWGEEDMARYAAHGVNIDHVRALMDRTFYGGEPDAIFDAFRSGDEDVRALAQVRRGYVLAFASALCSAARPGRPDFTLSAALMPEGAYDELAFSDLHYGQHYADLAGLLDMALPMAYSRAYDKDEKWVRQVALGTVRHGVAALIGLHAYEGGTADTLIKDMSAIGDIQGVKGACLFREGSFVWAFANDRRLSIVNPTDEIVTRVTVKRGEEEVSFDVSVPTGGQAAIELPFRPDIARAFAGDKELPAFLRADPD